MNSQADNVDLEQEPVSFNELMQYYQPTWLVVIGLISSAIVSA